jgi:DNA-directed RNA polymerase subunit beta'
VRFDGKVESDDSEKEPLQVDTAEDGTVTRHYKYRRVREDASGNLLSQHIRTTPGRIIYNKAVYDALSL